VSSDDSDDSMGLSVADRAYIWSIECAGFEGSDDSKGTPWRRRKRTPRTPRRATTAATREAVMAVLVVVVAATMITSVARCHRHK
jgi:hypothetical protein